MTLYIISSTADSPDKRDSPPKSKAKSSKSVLAENSSNNQEIIVDEKSPDLDECHDNGPKSLQLGNKCWLRDAHIDYGMEIIEKQHRRSFDMSFFITNSYLAEAKKKMKYFRYSDYNKYFAIINVRNHWILLTNKDLEMPNNIPERHQWVCYESLNDSKYLFETGSNFNASEPIKNFLNYILPDYREFSIKKVEIIPRQEGSDDCGLYCLAFLCSLIYNEDPGCINYDQDRLRDFWNRFVKLESSILSFYNTLVSLKRNTIEFNINVGESTWQSYEASEAEQNEYFNQATYTELR